MTPSLILKASKLRRLHPRVELRHAFHVAITEVGRLHGSPGAVAHAAGVSVVRATVRSCHARSSAGNIITEVRGRAEWIGHALQFAGDRVTITDRGIPAG